MTGMISNLSKQRTGKRKTGIHWDPCYTLPPGFHCFEKKSAFILTKAETVDEITKPSTHALTHTGVMDYDEACFMHLTPGVVHNFPKDVGV